MVRRTAGLIMAVVLVWALGAPPSARADAPGDPIATAVLARPGQVPAGVRARVVDGDLRLWLAASPTVTVEVLDQVGDPWLRFGRRGVFENRRSLMYLLARTPLQPVAPASIRAPAAPDWVRVSTGHAWMWPDERLGALADQSRPAGRRVIGNWSIPLRVGGRATAIVGVLVTAPSPSVLWFWPVAVILLCVPAAWRLGPGTATRRIVVGLTLGLLAALGVVALARLLHGRPFVSVVQGGELAVAAAVILTGAWVVSRGRHHTAVALIVACIALWAGLTFLPVLTHPYPMLVLPAWLDRAATALLLGGGLGLVPLALGRAGGSHPSAGTVPHPSAGSVPHPSAGDGRRPLPRGH